MYTLFFLLEATMKIIEKLSDDIERKIDQAECDAQAALELKENNPLIAEVYFKMANQGLTDISTLHAQVVTIIDEYKKKNGEPPEGMKMLYEILHRKHIEHTIAVKSMLSLYKET